ncbi:LOW QUALITY PROTEIN: putative membrane protein YeiH [Brevundimonas abyssalis TAR-001]|uniref:Putative membrane protein YeiH n=1 Tax=Brevundimonas abyssalis TAR-001 TaxID=1391729 RepID=A0A8E0NCB6_9CAUL|nr:LOW QUALITY PROTEIN: putative membrane protein YeiH [Brevundimonas abyssalis TAR-001]
MVAAVAMGLQSFETQVFDRIWLEGLVLAILIGAGVRTFWPPPETFRAGVAFSAGFLLEVAVVLLGASLSAPALAAMGPTLLLGIVLVVAVGVTGGYWLGRWCGLTRNAALLVPAATASCGNSAIVAVAPVIGAKGEEVSAAIGFTAVLGVGMVLLLPVVADLLGLSITDAGVLAGLTVYAVPQVLAAVAPMGLAAAQVGTLVKLTRVLMLGPVCIVLALTTRDRAGQKPGLARLIPWFILGFIAMAALRSFGLIPEALIGPITGVAGVLTVIAMAALGLTTDLRAVLRSGPRAALAAVLSLALLSVLALGLIGLLNLL